MHGLMIVNGFLRSDAFERMYAALFCAAQKAVITLEVVTNDALCPLDEAFFTREIDFVLFWDKDTRLACALEKRGLKVFNSAKSIALCDDKTLTYLALAGVVPMPETILAPLSFSGFGKTEFLTRVGEQLSYPYVLKEGCGSFGQQVYMIRDEASAHALLEQIGERPVLFQRLIAESAGRDARLYVVGDRCVAAIRRINEKDDFRANIAGGGRAEKYAPTREEEALALLATRALGLTFAGVDILFSKDGPLLCEVNSNAHFTALSAVTGARPAEDIMREIKRQCAAQ